MTKREKLPNFGWLIKDDFFPRIKGELHAFDWTIVVHLMVFFAADASAYLIPDQSSIMMIY